jgi:hypothetical protein
MEQVVSKPDNVPEQLRISANNVSEQAYPSIVDRCDQAYQDDPQPSRILKAMREGDSFKEMTIVE